MISFASWLNSHSYDLVNNPLYKGKLCRIQNKTNSLNELLKITSVNELNPQVVKDVVFVMNEVNNMNIPGLMKYRVIERDENCLYQVMREYSTVLDDIDPVKYFEDSDLFEVLNGILTVLKNLNENGTIHSDLKPSNIFFNDENEVVINDYLNNLLYKGKESKNSRCEESLCFVCIDELLGKDLDISSDIWNFGLIFYYIKSGKYPFVGSNMFETMKNICEVKYNPLECEYEEELNSFLRKILQKEKKDRLELNEVISGLKKLNKAELPVINTYTKYDIDSVIDDCIADNGNVLFFSLHKIDEQEYQQHKKVTGIDIE